MTPVASGAASIRSNAPSTSSLPDGRPSVNSYNAQPWSLLAVTDAAVRQKLADIVAEAIQGRDPMPAAETRPIDIQCFAITPDLTRQLARLSDDPTSALPRTVNGRWEGGGMTFTSDDGRKVELWLALALPDRVIVAGGG